MLTSTVRGRRMPASMEWRPPAMEATGRPSAGSDGRARLAVISNFFIDRPLFATVVSAFIVIAGLAAFRELPVAMYPNIAPPQISVSTVYPGASADVIAETVAAPLEQALNGVENMLYMRSGSSSTGSLTIAITFAVGTNADISVINVQNRVQSALQLLPEEVRRQGVTVAKSLPSFLMILTFDSPDGRYDDLFVSNYATLNVIDELRRIPGVGNVQVFGARDYSIRIWLRPDRLAELGLTPADVAAAVREQNTQAAAGRLGDEPTDERVDLTLSVTTQARLTDPDEFERIVLRTGANGEIVRLEGRRTRRARRTRLRLRAHAQGPADRRRGAATRARSERAPVRRRGLRENGRARQEIPRRPRRGQFRTTRASTCARRCARSRSRSSKRSCSCSASSGCSSTTCARP